MARSGVMVRVNRRALRHYRTTKLLTQKELGDAVGMTHLQISRIECGTQQSTSKNLSRIADALGIGVSELISEISE